MDTKKREEKVNEIFERVKVVFDEKLHELLKQAITLGYQDGVLQTQEEFLEKLK